MSRPGLMGDKGAKTTSGPNRSTVNDASGLFQTLQGHVDDLRALLQCGICIRPLYEPYTLACGHTFCYGCLTSWFAEGRSNHKTCPDCRAPVKSQPAPAYLVRAVVQMFTSRAELLEKGETTDQHKLHQREEADKLESDKKNNHPREGGLFRGVFNKTRAHIPQPVLDLEDNVVRCPLCSWELEEDSGCAQCGYRLDMDSMSGTDYTGTETGSEMSDDFDEDVEDGFGEPDDFDMHAWYEGVPVDAIAAELHHPIHALIQNNTHLLPGAHNFFANHHDHSELDSHDSIHDSDEDEEDEEDEDEDTDMDGFINDDEHDDYSSDSDRSTVVGTRGYSREQLHAIYDDQPSSEYSVDHSGIDDSDAIPESDEDEIEEDEEEEEEPIRPPMNGNRRRGPTYQILSSSPAHATAEAIRNGRLIPSGSNTTRLPMTAQSRDVRPAGSSALHAIDIDDDSDEGPVGPVRRSRGNCWPEAR